MLTVSDVQLRLLGFIFERVTSVRTGHRPTGQGLHHAPLHVREHLSADLAHHQEGEGARQGGHHEGEEPPAKLATSSAPRPRRTPYRGEVKKPASPKPRT